MRMLLIACAALLLAGPRAHSQPGHASPLTPKIIFDSSTVRASQPKLRLPQESPNSGQCNNEISSFDRAITVSELAGQNQFPVRDVCVKRYFPGIPSRSKAEIRKTLSNFWQGKFNTAYCTPIWEEVVLWSTEADIEFYDGTRGQLITDGSHVYVKSHDGKSWFLRLLPAGQ